MKIWHYHPTTGVLLGEGLAEPCQVDHGAWLIPAYATAMAPPATEADEEAVWQSGAWSVRKLPPAPPPPPPAPVVDVSFWQFMMAARDLHFITHEQALAAVQSRIMPPAFADAISGLPQAARQNAALKFAGIQRMLRSDPLFDLVVAANIATDEQIDGVFAVAATIT